jgi:hypothetical protein
MSLTPATRPADDFRFEIVALEEPEMGCTHRVTVIELRIEEPGPVWPCETLVDGEVIESFTTDDPYGAVEAAREAQAYTLEERLAMYAERGW